MCGRFVLMTPGKSLAEHFHLTEEPDLEPRYNIAPTQMVVVIRSEHELARRELKVVKWGLIPFWAKDSKIGAKLINARSETAAEKPAFRAAFKNRRCLIPTDGFFEWDKLKTGRQPYLIRMANQRTFALAGLWERWEDPNGEVIESCTVLTTDANDLVQSLHDRMPVILAPEDYDLWLNTDLKKPESLKPLLKPYPSDEMVAYPVSGKCNKATYDAPDCVREINTD